MLRLRVGEEPKHRGAVSDDQDGRGALPPEILQSVAADLVATLGWPIEEAETFVRQNSGAWCAGVPRVILVAEDVQQRLHDDRIDITWPTCPEHPHHPLRLSDKLPAVWTCPSMGYPVCALGGLASVTRGGLGQGPEPTTERTSDPDVFGDRTHRFVAPPGVINRASVRLAKSLTARRTGSRDHTAATQPKARERPPGVDRFRQLSHLLGPPANEQLMCRYRALPRNL